LKRLQREGIEIRDKTKIHQEVIDAYMDSGFTSIGDKLDQLRERRLDADYHMIAELVLNECRGYSEMSQLTIELIEQISVFP
jgi:hypothetical protein